MVVGAAGSGKSLTQGRLVWLDKNNKTVLVKDYGADDAHESLRGVSVQVDGTAWVAGTRTKDGKVAGWAARITKTGQALWDKPQGGKNQARLASAVARADGTAVFAGARSVVEGGKIVAWQGMLLALAADGKLLWQRTIGGAGERGLEAAIGFDDGSIRAAGWQKSKGGSNPWVVKVDGEGELAWERVGSGLFHSAAMVPTAGTLFAVAGKTALNGGVADAWIAGMDGAGNTHWTSGYAGDEADVARGVASLPEGGLFVVGVTEDKKRKLGLVMRTDPWGHSSCAEAGTCAAKKPDACADNSQCTIDFCTVKGGCKHVASSGLACDPADGCTLDGQCKDGQCLPGKKARLFSKEHVMGDLLNANAVALTSTGGYIVAGCTVGKKLWVLRLDRFGQVDPAAGKSGQTAFSCSYVAGVIPLSGGHVAIALSDPSGTAPGRMIRLDADLATVWSLAKAMAWSSHSTTLRHVTSEAGGQVAITLGRGAYKYGYYPAVTQRIDLAKGAKIGGYGYAGKAGYYHHFEPNRIISVQPGVVLVAGSYDYTKDSTPRRGSITKASTGGSQYWTTVAPTSKTSYVRAVAVRADGNIVAAGTNWSGADHLLWLLRLNAKGQVSWQRTYSKVGPHLPNAIFPGEGNTVLLTGTIKQKQQSLWMGWYDGLGNPASHRVFPASKSADVASAWYAPSLQLPTGGYALLGTRKAFGKAQAMLVRTDAWGNASCDKSGACVKKPANGCTDNDPCTFDACSAAGCSHKLLSCEDNNACTKNDTCLDGKCSSQKVVCNDGDLCTNDSCNPAKGCVYVHNTKPCPDASKCTWHEVCKAGKCVSDKVPCQDGKACTTDGCEPEQGCVFKAIANGGACETPCGKGTCKSGACTVAPQKPVEPGAKLLPDSAWSWPTPKLKDAGAIAMMPDGNYAMAGCTTDKWLKVLIAGKNGVEKASAIKNGLDKVPCGWVAGVLATKDGGLIVGVNGPSGSHTGDLVRLNSKLAQVWYTTNVFSTGHNSQLHAIVGAAGGQQVIAVKRGYSSQCCGNSYTYAYMRRFDANKGGILANPTYAGTAGKAHHYYVYRVGTFDGGDLAVAGYHDYSKDSPPAQGWVSRVSTGGSHKWQLLAPTKYSGVIRAVAPLSANAFVAAGYQTVASVQRPWILRFDASGKLLFSRLMKKELKSVPTEIHTIDLHHYVIGGRTATADGSPALWLSWRNLDGNPLFSRQYSVGFGATVAPAWNALVTPQSGGLALLGTRKGFGTASPYLVRTDNWGNEVCVDNAQCVGKKPADCDDKNDCTVDFCHAAKGCLHTALTCDDGNACTNQEACKGGACVSKQLDCNDANICTTDSCNPDKGCVNSNNSAKCPDGDACTHTEVCSGGKCVMKITVCGDGKPCTVDKCDSKKGCVFTGLGDGHECVSGCGKGKCIKGECIVPKDSKGIAAWTWPVSGLKDSNAVASRPGGGFAIGSTSAGNKLNLVLVDAKGDLTRPPATFDGKGFHALSGSYVAGLVARGDGGFTISMNNPAHTHRHTIYGVDKDLNFQWSQTSAASGSSSSYPTHLLPLAGGQQVLALTNAYASVCCGKSYYYVRMRRFDAVTGKAISGTANGSSAAYYRYTFARDARVLGDGTVLIAGQQRYTKGKTYRGWLIRVTTGGSIAWQNMVDSDNFASELWSATILPDKTFFAAGHRVDAANRRMLFARVNGKGQVLWQRVDSKPTAHWPRGMRPMANGDGVILAGATVSGGVTPGLWGGLFDLQGNAHVQRTWLGDKDDKIHVAGYRSFIPQTDGGFALLGTRKAFGKAAPWLIRSDAWLFGVCTGSGPCADKTAKACGDNKPCTFDVCKAQTGCDNDPLSCNDGNACTQDQCALVQGCTHSKVDCSDGDACTTDSCDVWKGCKHTKKSCNDSNACTADSCDKAQGCLHALVNCNDGNICTTDSCSKTKGCVTVPANDHKPCAASKTCKKGVCQ